MRSKYLNYLSIAIVFVSFIALAINFYALKDVIKLSNIELNKNVFLFLCIVLNLLLLGYIIFSIVKKKVNYLAFFLTLLCDSGIFVLLLLFAQVEA